MTITIRLPEVTSAALRADAAAQGRAVEQVAAERLAGLYAEQDSLEDAVNESLDEGEAGQGRPFEEFITEFEVRFNARYGFS